jgi:hypothetical protein
MSTMVFKTEAWTRTGRMPCLSRFALMAAVASLGCAAPAAAGGQRGGAPPGAADTAADTALLSAVVRAARADLGTLRMVVDPRPLRDVLEVTFTEPSFARAAPVVLRAREAALRSAGAEPGDAVALGRTDGCGGRLYPVAPADSVKGEPDPHAGCPREGRFVLGVGLARPGKERLPAGQVYGEVGIPAEAALGYWAVRVIVKVLSPGGSSVTGYDYVMKKEGARWEFVKAVPLFVLE